MSNINNTNFVKTVRFIYDNIDQPIKLEEVASAMFLEKLSGLSTVLKLSGEPIKNLTEVMMHLVRDSTVIAR